MNDEEGITVTYKYGFKTVFKSIGVFNYDAEGNLIEQVI